MIGLVYNSSSPVYIQALEQFKRLGEYKEFNEKIVDAKLSECDSFVLVGNDIKDRPVKEWVYRSGKPFYIITGNYFNIKDDGYVRILVNGYLNNFGQIPSIPDFARWEQIKKHYKLTDNLEQKPGSKIILALNSKHSPSLFNIKLEEWVVDTVTKIRQVSDRPIHIRHHRKQKQPYTDKIKEVNKFKDIHNEYDISEGAKSFKDVGTSITINSTYCVLSLLNGISNIATHPGSPIYNIVKNDVTAESLNYYPSKETLINYYGTISNCMWKVNEVASDNFLELYNPLIKENKRENFHWLGS